MIALERSWLLGAAVDQRRSWTFVVRNNGRCCLFVVFFSGWFQKGLCVCSMLLWNNVVLCLNVFFFPLVPTSVSMYDGRVWVRPSVCGRTTRSGRFNHRKTLKSRRSKAAHLSPRCQCRHIWQSHGVSGSVWHIWHTCVNVGSVWDVWSTPCWD